GINSHTFGSTRPGGRFVGIGNERNDLSVLDVADANPSLPARMVPGNRTRLGIRHIDVVALVDENAARPTEVGPLIEVVAVLIENLNPVVVAIADEQSAFGIECQAVRLIELGIPATGLSPSLDQLAVLRELEDF